MPAYKIKTDFKFKKRVKSFRTMGGSGHFILMRFSLERSLPN